MLRQEQEIITMRVSVEVRRGTIPGRSLACLSSPRCLRPKHSLGLQARSSHLLRKHKQPLGDPALDCCTVDVRINISHQSSRGLAAKPCSEECGFCY